MYLPEAFAERDSDVIFTHLESHPFATLVTSRPQPRQATMPPALEASHVPLLVDAHRRVLRGHLAAANPQVADLASGAEALAIFHGPHGYVSPSVYVQAGPSVPTWNFVVVHVRGRARIVGRGELRTIVDDLVKRFDRSNWQLDESPEFLDLMLGAIAGFEIAIESIEGKWKLSQNRSIEDRKAVIAWLEGEGPEGESGSRSVAREMRASLARNTPEAPES